MQADKDGLDQPFEDYAWTQMNVLLDQELPVQEEKKRRWLFWLLLFFGLSLGGAVAYQVFQNGETEKKMEVERPIAEGEKSEVRSQKSDSEIIESSVKNRDEMLAKREDLIAKNENHSIRIESTTSNQVESPQTTSNNLKPSQTQSNNIEQLQTVSSSKLETPIEPSNHQILESVSKLKTSDQQIDESTSQQINKSLIVQSFNPFFPVRPMNVSPIEPITSATRSITAEPIVRKISKWELAARLGGIATLDGETHFTLGTTIQYHFKPKWSMRLGASWITKQNNNLFSLSEADAAVMDLEMMDTMGSNVRTPISNNSEAFELAFQDSIIRADSPKHHFLNIPLSVEYRISNRWGAYGGVEVLLPFRRENDALNANQFTTTAFDPNPADQNKRLFNAYPIQASWQWHTGVHFRATERFSFDFSYHHVLPQQGGRNHLGQYFQLGLRYNIFSP